MQSTKGGGTARLGVWAAEWWRGEAGRVGMGSGTVCLFPQRVEAAGQVSRPQEAQPV